jgi:FKBP-type peptidyl-prolyl cis-trans isomerase
LVFGSQLASNGLGSTLSRESLVRGIDEALGGKIPSPAQKESAQQFIRAARTTLAAHNTERARLFLEKNARESGIQTLPSGVQYRVLAPGDPTAPLPGPRDEVTLRYRASLADGTEIDRSDDHSQPAVFRLNSVIKGWHEALSAMRPGAKWQVFVPPELGYGANPPPPIPPGALLVYELELLRVEAGTPTLPDRGPPVPRKGDSEVAPKVHAAPSSPAK